MKVFIDLESTLIDDFDNLNLLEGNINKIKSFLKILNVKEILLWSFAIMNQEDIKKFNESLKDKLEKALELKIEILEIEKCFKDVCKANNISAEPKDLTDIFLFEPKSELLKQWLIVKGIEDHCLLIDDQVEASVFQKGGLILQCLKI